MQNEIAQQQTSDPVPTPYRAIITDSNQYLAISTKDDIETKYLNDIKYVVSELGYNN